MRCKRWSRTVSAKAPDGVAGERSSYHHGNLREALIEATVALIEERGPLAFTLAEAARQAGVSGAAPYRHFKGRDELLEEVARRGFIDFADRLESAFDGGRPRPMTALMRLGEAYLAFARERPGFYMAMFEAGLAIVANSDLAAAADRAEAVLIDAAEALFSHRPPAERPPARMVANHIFAMSHGVVELFSRGRPGGRSPISPGEMLESGVLIYLRGLGLMDG